MLTVAVLGPVEARAGDRLVTPPGAKQRALLALLSLDRGRTVPAGRLIEGLWGIEPPADPVHALHAHVSRLRKVLPVPLVGSDRGYRLPAEEIDLDADRFSELVHRGRATLRAGAVEAAAAVLREALDLWRGSAFAELAVTPGLRPHALRLEEHWLEAVTDRIEADLARGVDEEIVGELESLLEQHPLHERLWGQLLVALHRTGRQADSLHAYQRAREMLVAQAGVEPGRALTQLHERVLSGRAPVAESVARPPGFVGQVVELPLRLPPELGRRLRGSFAGRQPALGWLADRRALGTRLVLIAGEPGIGKTRLAAEFAAQEARDGVRVLFGRCDEFLSVPYQPFAEMLHADLSDLAGSDDSAPSSSADLVDRFGPYAGELVPLLPELGDLLPPGRDRPSRSDADTERHRLYEAVAGWLSATPGPVLLVLDDLQWANLPTLMLLRHVVRSPTPTLILATVRDDAHDVSDRSADVIADLLRDREAVQRSVLTGLSSEAIVEVVAAEHATGSPPVGLAARIEAETGGNPFFVVELARHLLDDGPGEQPRVPDTIREVVARQLRALPGDASTLLDQAAVVGRQFDARVVQAVSGLTDDHLDQALAAATGARLIERGPGAGLQYAFAHDLVRTAIYEAIAPVRRLTIHRQVGEAIEALHLGDLRPHHPALAHHFGEGAEGGSSPEAVAYLTLAGDAALDQRAPAAAATHYQRGLQLLAADAPAEQRCDLLTSHGLAQLQAGDGGYRESLLTAGRLARAAGDAHRLATAAIANTRGWFSSSAETDHDRVELLTASLQVCAVGDGATRARLLSGLALETVLDPVRRLDAVAKSHQALAIARERGDDGLLASTLSTHSSVVHASFTDPRGCVQISAELVELARASADPGLRLRAALDHTQTTLLTGDLATSDVFLDRAERDAARLDQPARLWLARAFRAARLGLRGRLDEAEEASTAAFELGTATGQPDAATWFAGQLFTIRWQQGRLGELVDAIEEQVTEQADRVPAWRAAHAVALVQVGRTEEAARVLDDVVTDGRVLLPPNSLWLQGVAYLCTVSEHLRRPDVARVLHDALAPYSGLLACNGAISAGPVDAHLGAMSRLVGQHERATVELAAAEAMCRRIDAPLWLDRVRRPPPADHLPRQVPTRCANESCGGPRKDPPGRRTA